MPNIKGSWGVNGTDQGQTSSGAVYASGDMGGAGYGHHSGYHYNAIFTIDASRSSSVYGKSSTVTPANWGLKIILKALPTPPSNAVPTGTILDYTGESAPDGYIIANGAELSRETFRQLYQWAVANDLVIDQANIPTTAHGYYGTGDGSTTFTIPDLRGVFKRCADLASNRGGAGTGEYQPDGLPNIKGTATAIGGSCGFPRSTATFTGAFYNSKTLAEAFSVSSGGDGATFAMDASRYNKIYGASAYVQPKSVSILPILKY